MVFKMVGYGKEKREMRSFAHRAHAEDMHKQSQAIEAQCHSCQQMGSHTVKVSQPQEEEGKACQQDQESCHRAACCGHAAYTHSLFRHGKVTSFREQGKDLYDFWHPLRRFGNRSR
jgi:hypothetical protein